MNLFDLLLKIDNNNTVNIIEGKNVLFLGEQGDITFEFLEAMKNKKVVCINSCIYDSIGHLIEIEVK